MRRDHRNPNKVAHLPNLVMRHDSESSPFTFAQGSSINTRLGGSPPHLRISPSVSDYSRESSPSSELHSPSTASSYELGKLVPLECLQNATGPRRNPVDEQLLRRFSAQAIGSAHVASNQPVRTL